MVNLWTKQKLVLLHPPKTGGTALSNHFTRQFGPRAVRLPSHLYMAEVVDRWTREGDLEDFTWAITVRDPYEKLVSAYKFFGYYKSGCPFDDFAKTYAESGERQWHRMGCPMVSWLNLPLPVRVYKCENLNSAFPGIGVDRPSKGPSSDVLLTDKAVKLVNDVYAADFERFGYEQK